MRVFYDLEQLPTFKRAVVTIGSFDGVHLGHQQLIRRINQLASRVGGESVVVTFHPHPRQIVYPKDDTLKLLTTIHEKVSLFERFGVDNLVVVPFSVAFSQLSADEYIQRFLLDKFQPHTIVIGYDHKFGLNRQGDIAYLKWYSQGGKYHVEEIPPREVDDIAVSSTKIRKALLAGRVGDANKWLGHDYTLVGKVVRGQQLGAKLGFPTANLAVAEPFKLVPADGIYACQVRHEGELYGGMLYIGHRPSIQGVDELTIEVNIFDFDDQIYGHEITVYIQAFLREDQRFDSLEALASRLHEDKRLAVQYLTEKANQPAEPTPSSTAIVILNYNGAAHLRRFLPSVIAHQGAENQQIIVADNGSTDESVSLLAREFPAVKLIQMPDNLGFAAGYNEALRQVDADFYVLLNSDVAVGEGWLQPCLDVLAQDVTVAACQPKIKSVESPDTFEYAGAAGGWLDLLGYPFCRGRIFSTIEPDTGQYDNAEEIFWASGAVLVIRAELFHAFGGFDAEYFAHAEEIDLCWRLKRAGYKIMAVPQAAALHLGGGTLDYLSPRKTYLNFHNTLVTSFKNEPWRKLLWWLPLRLVMDGMAGALFLSQGKWPHIAAIVRAHWHFFPRMGHWYRRKVETDASIRRLAIGAPNMATGVFRGSVVWAYYFLQKTTFQSLSIFKKGREVQ
jgi:riboflavin kinase/FMN adenylyltransferase